MGLAENLSEFEVTVEAATNKILRNKIKYWDKILRNHRNCKNSEITYAWNSWNTLLWDWAVNKIPDEIQSR